MMTEKINDVSEIFLKGISSELCMLSYTRSTLSGTHKVIHK